MKKSPQEIYYQFEDTIPKLIKIFIKKNLNSLLLDSNNLNLKKTCEKFLYTTLHTSPTFFKLFEDIKESNPSANFYNAGGEDLSSYASIQEGINTHFIAHGLMDFIPMTVYRINDQFKKLG